MRIIVSDLSASKSFYSKVLAEDHPCLWCGQKLINTFSVNSIQYIELVPILTKAPADLIDEITFETDDVPGLWKYLTAQGVQASSLTPELRDNSQVRQLLPFALDTTKKVPSVPDTYFSVVDPEGHRIGFVQISTEAHKSLPASDGRRLIHAGIIVKDRAAEDHFYKGLLGFQLYWHGWMQDDKDDWVDMQVPDGSDWIEYMLDVPADADKQTLGAMNHVAIGVPDVAQSAYEVKKKGLSYAEEPHIGRDGKWQLNLNDPDGTRIELVEFTPVQSPCCNSYTGPHPKP